MEFITWNDRYSVQVQLIDDQHKKLIKLINRMYDGMKAGKGREVMGPVLAELVNYTVEHFALEERLFEEHGYPEHEEHKQMHDDLAEKAKRFKEEFESGNTARTIDVMLFLSNWLNLHILEVDKKYAPYLIERGVR